MREMLQTTSFESLPLVKHPSLEKEYPVQVRSAGFKGNGVFATRNIKKGEVCCWYDGVVTSTDSFCTLVAGTFGYNIAYYDTFVGGFRRQLRPGGCAQICNDAAIDYDSTDDPDYVQKINVIAHTMNGVILFIANKRIKKRGELLFSYGPGYWKSKKVYTVTIDASAEQLFERIASLVKDTSKELVPQLIESYTGKGDDKADYLKRFIVTKMLLSFVMQSKLPTMIEVAHAQAEANTSGCASDGASGGTSDVARSGLARSQSRVS